MVNFKKMLLSSAAGGDSYWMATFHYFGENHWPGNAQEIDGQVVTGGNFQDRNYVASLDAQTGDCNFTFATKGRYRFDEAEADLGYAPPSSALYDPYNDVYAISGFYDGSTTGTNISGRTVQMVIYDRNSSTSASQLNRTWGKNYQDGGATADSFSFNSVGDLITGGIGVHQNRMAAWAILYDQSNTGYGAAYTPTKGCYLINTNTSFSCRMGWLYLNSSEELIFVGNHNKPGGYLQFGVAKVSGSTWNTLDFNKGYTYGNGSDDVYAVSYNKTLDHVAILHKIDVDSSYSGVTLVDCSDGSVTNSFRINNVGGTSGLVLGRVIALDSQWNVYVGWQNINAGSLTSNEHPFMKINNANNTSPSMEWLHSFKNAVAGNAQLEYCHINENDTPILTFASRNNGSGTNNAHYVMKMPPDGSAASTSGTLYFLVRVYDKTSSAAGSSVSFTNKSSNLTTATGSVSLNVNYPDDISFSNSSGLSELEDYHSSNGSSYETPIT